jgi:hypothetical protein
VDGCSCVRSISWSSSGIIGKKRQRVTAAKPHGSFLSSASAGFDSKIDAVIAAIAATTACL